jgi:hypothetical protein
MRRAANAKFLEFKRPPGRSGWQDNIVYANESQAAAIGSVPGPLIARERFADELTKAYYLPKINVPKCSGT